MAKLDSRLSELADDFPKFNQLALQMTGTALTSLIRQLVPVDTGDLRNSYISEVYGNSLRVGSNRFLGVYRRGYPTYYAPQVEFGLGQSAQPHFVPAWKQARATYTAVITKLWRDWK